MINKTILVGRVGKDPETREFQTGKLATFSLATTKKYTDKSGEKQEATEWHNIIVNGKLADVAEKYVKKGDLLYIEGEIKYQEYEDKAGVKKTTTRINCLTLQMLSSKEPTQPAPQTARPYQPAPKPKAMPEPEESCDLPF